ncbi:MAG: hypothetical protein MUF16_01825 [Burkholderiaceae bacterium]|jgi:hypothetical protein|nr:hypothetical protein [Burkholderiaceae bacterium]
MTHAPAFPHDRIEPVADDVFVVRGSLRLNPLVRISRSMTVLRVGAELTLLNAIRLGPQGEAELRRLGRVVRIVTLGALHGLDDAWYQQQHGAEIWTRPGSRRYPPLPGFKLLGGAAPLPVPGTRLFTFDSAAQPESALLLERGGGLLVTADSVQHYGDYHQHSPFAKMVMPFIGFPKTTLVGPIWLKEVTPRGGSLRGDFERLLQWRFDSLMSAHGSFLARGAHAAVAAAVRKAFS